MGIFQSLFAPQEAGVPFRFQIEDVFGVKGRGAVVAGRILTGRVRVGDQVAYRPDPRAPPRPLPAGWRPLSAWPPGPGRPNTRRRPTPAVPLQGRCALLLREQEAPAFRPGGCLTREE